MRVRPVLCMSLCLGDAPVRYDGAAIADAFAKRLAEHVELRPVCPEVEIGLGVPRAPIQIERGRLVQPSTGIDLSDRMRKFAAGFLDGLGEVDGFLLKAKSPSCGVVDTKRGPSGLGAGFFAEAVLERHPGIPVEDEKRMAQRGIREHFLTRLFAAAELRSARKQADLVAFHARHKLLLLACNERAMRSLGRLVAKRPFGESIGEYRAGFGAATSEPPKPGPLANALEHAFGHLSDALSPVERRRFLGARSLGVRLDLLRGWLARHPRPYLQAQSLFDPFPAELSEA